MVEPDGAPRTRVGETFNALRHDIVSGALPPGSRLGVESLRERYGVGSSTLREALSLLVADALVTAEGQRGFRVSEVSAADLADLSAVRVLLECRALRESIVLGDDNWEAAIVASFHRITKAQDRLDACDEGAEFTWEARNREFHSALVAGCDSRWIHHMLGMLHHHSERYRHMTMIDHKVPRDVHAEHTALVEATLARDADRACSLLEAHILRTAEIVAEITAARLPDVPGSRVVSVATMA